MVRFVDGRFVEVKKFAIGSTCGSWRHSSDEDGINFEEFKNLFTEEVINSIISDSEEDGETFTVYVETPSDEDVNILTYSSFDLDGYTAEDIAFMIWEEIEN